MPFRYSNDEFAVICTGLNLQFAALDSSKQLTLHKLQVGSGEDGVLLESDSQVKSVSYIAYDYIEVYTVNTAEAETINLPENINCLDIIPVKLYPIHGQEKFLLSCTTKDGPTLYVVPLNHNENARSIEVEGRPYSSPNGTYIAVVNGSRVTTYVTADSTIQGKPHQFTSEVSKLEFLDSQNVLILTRDSEHIILDINEASKSPRYLPGGVPVSWVWVSPSNHYAFVTQSSTLYVLNATSTNALYDPKPITNRPEMLLFVKKYVAPATNPTDDNTSQSPPDLGGDSSGGSSNLGAILGSLVGGVVLMIIVIIGVILLVIRRRKKSFSQEEESRDQNSQLVTSSAANDTNDADNHSNSADGTGSNSNSASATTTDHDSVSGTASWLYSVPISASGLNNVPSGPNNMHSTSASAEVVSIARQPTLEETEHNQIPLQQNKVTVPEREAEHILLFELDTQPKDQPHLKKIPSPSLPRLSPRSPPHSPRVFYSALQDLSLPIQQRRSKPGPDIMPFKETTSYVRKTSTDPSIIGRPEEEETASLLHADLPC